MLVNAYLTCERLANVSSQLSTCLLNCCCVFHIRQLEISDTSLPTLVCRVKAALDSEVGGGSWTQRVGGGGLGGELDLEGRGNGELDSEGGGGELDLEVREWGVGLGGGVVGSWTRRVGG